MIAPTYNNAGTLFDALHGIAPFSESIWVVNDGSTDQTAVILQDWAMHGDGNRQVLTHAVNRGKGAALLTGMRAALADGFTHALTIDTDGQLDPSQIPELIAEARSYPDSLILGTRDSHAADYPLRSRLGRTLSNLMIWLESRQRVRDSQCGFRVYPLRALNHVSPRAPRYAMETEIITLFAWAGFAARNIPVRCTYLRDHEGPGLVSHFRVGRETRQAITMHARLLGRRLIGRHLDR